MKTHDWQTWGIENWCNLLQSTLGGQKVRVIFQSSGLRVEIAPHLDFEDDRGRDIFQCIGTEWIFCIEDAAFRIQAGPVNLTPYRWTDVRWGWTATFACGTRMMVDCEMLVEHRKKLKFIPESPEGFNQYHFVEVS